MAKADEDRARRLAEALRQNLRRRKAQARGEEGEGLTDLGNDPSPLQGEGEGTGDF